MNDLGRTFCEAGEGIAELIETFDADLSRYLRDSGERGAKHGPLETAERFREVLAGLGARLANHPGDRLVDMRGLR